MDFPDLPDFLRVENQTPLSPELQAKHQALLAKLQLHQEGKQRFRSETERAYYASKQQEELERRALNYDKAQEFFAKKHEEAAAIKAVKEEAKRVHRQRKRRRK